MPDDVVFWKWVTPEILGLVTETSVYHWQGTGESAPQKVFDRHASLTGSQIINYRVNSDEKWMLLVGISAQVRRARFLLFTVIARTCCRKYATLFQGAIRQPTY